jgi:hypothetical protein
MKHGRAGMKLMENQGNRDVYTRLAVAPKHMERLPVTLSAK